jgi:hypothetical protein
MAATAVCSQNQQLVGRNFSQCFHKVHEQHAAESVKAVASGKVGSRKADSESAVPPLTHQRSSSGSERVAHVARRAQRPPGACGSLRQGCRACRAHTRVLLTLGDSGNCGRPAQPQPDLSAVGSRDAGAANRQNTLAESATVACAQSEVFVISGPSDSVDCHSVGKGPRSREACSLCH